MEQRSVAQNGKHAYCVQQLKIQYHTYGLGRYWIARGRRGGGKSIIITFKNISFLHISTHSDRCFLEDVRAMFLGDRNQQSSGAKRLPRLPKHNHIGTYSCVIARELCSSACTYTVSFRAIKRNSFFSNLKCWQRVTHKRKMPKRRKPIFFLLALLFLLLSKSYCETKETRSHSPQSQYNKEYTYEKKKKIIWKSSGTYTLY